MSNDSIPGCIVHKDSRNIQTRLDYMLLFRNETKAKIIRIMETWTDQKRAEWYKLQKDNKEAHAEEPPDEALWVTMSYEEFSTYAYGTMNHDTIKKNVDDLVEHEYMQRRPHPIPGLAPQYLLDTKLLQEVLDEQELPSLFDDIGKIRPPRKKHTPLEKYPQGEGINTRGDIGKIPPGTGEKSYPSKNISKNYLESTNNKDGIVVSAIAENDAPAPINFVERKSDKYKAITKEEIASHSQQAIRNDDDEDISLAETTKHKAMPKQTPAANVQAHSSSSDTAQPATPPSGAVQASVVPKRPRGKVTQATPKSPEELAIDERCRALQQRINEWRGYPLEAKGQIINEYKSIRKLVEKYTDQQIEDIYVYLFTRHWKWSKPDNRYHIGAYVVLSEAQSVLQELKAPTPAQNGKAPTFVIDEERNRRNIEAMKARNAARRLAANG